MSQRSKARKAKKGLKWVDNANGNGATVQDSRTRSEKVQATMKVERAISREIQIESGCSPRSGMGVQGGTRKQQLRRERRDIGKKLRRGDDDV